MELGAPRFHFVPLPKAAAWLNLIEGFGRSCASARSRDALRTPPALDWGIATMVADMGCRSDSVRVGKYSQATSADEALLRLLYLRNDALVVAFVAPEFRAEYSPRSHSYGEAW